MQQTSEIEKQAGKTVGRSAWVRGAAILLALVLSFHFAATALWVSPAAPLGKALAPVLNPYMQPFFQQGWSLFAPNPYQGDFTLLLRARWTDRSTGELRTTDWVDISRREESGILHNPLHSRSDMVTYGLYQALIADRDNLTNYQASICERDYSHSGWDQLLADLSAQKRADRDWLESYVRHERVAAAFATQYAYALWGPDVEAVQIRLKYTPVPTFEDRAGRDAQPKSVFTYYGWRPTVVFDGQSQKYFAAAVLGGHR
jgi:Family of unknown function (DUF5819)